jgi:hypothetical protein
MDQDVKPTSPNLRSFLEDTLSRSRSAPEDRVVWARIGLNTRQDALAGAELKIDGPGETGAAWMVNRVTLQSNKYTIGALSLAAPQEIRVLDLLLESPAPRGSEALAFEISDTVSDRLVHSISLADGPTPLRLLDKGDYRIDLVNRGNREAVAVAGVVSLVTGGAVSREIELGSDAEVIEVPATFHFRVTTPRSTVNLSLEPETANKQVDSEDLILELRRGYSSIDTADDPEDMLQRLELGHYVVSARPFGTSESPWIVEKQTGPEKLNVAWRLRLRSSNLGAR